jgi:hypothetical protein
VCHFIRSAGVPSSAAWDIHTLLLSHNPNTWKMKSRQRAHSAASLSSFLTILQQLFLSEKTNKENSFLSMVYNFHMHLFPPTYIKV